MRFNRVLSALEAVHGVASPVVKSADPVLISDFIHHVFENASDYNIDGLSKEWFSNLACKQPTKAVSFVGGFLEEQGHLVSRQALHEAVNIFRSEESQLPIH